MALSRREQLNDKRWLDKCEEIKKRDNYSCQVCGSKIHFLEAHHLYYEPGLLAWEYTNDALVTICRLHHEQITYDMPKIAGLIAFEALRMKIDLSYLLELLQQLKKDKRL